MGEGLSADQIARAGARIQARAESLRMLVLAGAGVLVLVWLVLQVDTPDSAPEAPPAVVFAPLPDFGAIGDVATKKRTFFGYLMPMIEARNREIRRTRAFLQEARGRLAAGEALSGETRQRLETLAERYRVAAPAGLGLEEVDLLLRRVDVLPPSLVLAQAATESAWGTSRFARVANNLFGEWCFTEGCGVVPRSRVEGATHEVEEFDSIYASVQSYFRNLNSHPAYAEVRERRAAARARGEPIRGLDLAAGLTRYSERGEHYVEELRAIIRVNDLAVLDRVAPTQTAMAE